MMLSQHLIEAAQGEANVVNAFSTNYGSFQVRESVLFGPGGALKLETTWQVMADGSFLFKTLIPKGGP